MYWMYSTFAQKAYSILVINLLFLVGCLSTAISVAVACRMATTTSGNSLEEEAHWESGSSSDSDELERAGEICLGDGVIRVQILGYRLFGRGNVTSTTTIFARLLESGGNEGGTEAAQAKVDNQLGIDSDGKLLVWRALPLDIVRQRSLRASPRTLVFVQMPKAIPVSSILYISSRRIFRRIRVRSKSSKNA